MHGNGFAELGGVEHHQIRALSVGGSEVRGLAVTRWPTRQLRYVGALAHK